MLRFHSNIQTPYVMQQVIDKKKSAILRILISVMKFREKNVVCVQTNDEKNNAGSFQFGVKVRKEYTQ